MLKIKLLIVALLCIFSSWVFGLEVGGPPTKAQVLGYWKMKEWPNPSALKVNPWPLRYQWFAFYEDGRMLSMMTTENGEYSAKELSEIFAALPAEAPKYELDGQFLLVTHPNIPGYMEVWGVNLFAKDVGNVVKKGNLVMSLAGGEDGAPVYYRMLEKVE